MTSATPHTKMLSVLLRCYPARFRNRFGDELIRATLERYRANVGTRGRTRAVGSLLLDVVNVVISGFAERLWKPGSRRSPNRQNPNEPQGRKDPIMSTLIQDLRFAIRTLAKQSVFAAIVVLTVALGVGANTAMFSIVYGVLLRPLPYEDSAELVIVYQTDRFNNTTLEGASGPDYFDYLEMQTVFERMAAWTGFNPTLAVPERFPWIPYYGYGAGVVRLSLGDNSELGGNVTGGYVRWNFFVDATVTVGRDVWVRDGKLLDPNQ